MNNRPPGRLMTDIRFAIFTGRLDEVVRARVALAGVERRAMVRDPSFRPIRRP